VPSGPAAPLPTNDIEAGRQQLGLTRHDLWLGYFELGGNGSLADVARWLAGDVRLPATDHDVLAVALNEAFSERGLNHPVLYSNHDARSDSPG
jgi:hypothetical protein